MDGTALQDNMKGVNKDAMSEGEKFVIEKITKLVGDTWLFQMRFQYGDHDVSVPVPIRVRAGETPVLTPSEVPDFRFRNLHGPCADLWRTVCGNVAIAEGRRRAGVRQSRTNR